MTAGYRISYPTEWWAGEGSTAAACRWFHPGPFDLPDAPRDVPEVAITVRVEDHPLAEARTLDPDQHDILADERTTVDGRAAVVQEYVLHGDGLHPAGTTAYRYLVEAGDRTLSGMTTDAADADYGDSRVTLDAIMANLEVLTEGSAAGCAAGAGDARPEPQAGLPGPVAELRAAIAEAAVACDYDRLAELAGEGFACSFDDGDFARHLRRQEDRGEEPLRHLVALLDAPFATVALDGSTLYVWPSAFAYDDWGDVSPAERDALRSLYDEDDFELFEQFGGYVGYRIGITADGHWRFFIAGD